jgi:hypothetical protein
MISPNIWILDPRYDYPKFSEFMSLLCHDYPKFSDLGSSLHNDYPKFYVLKYLLHHYYPKFSGCAMIIPIFLY